MDKKQKFTYVGGFAHRLKSFDGSDDVIVINLMTDGDGKRHVFFDIVPASQLLNQLPKDVHESDTAKKR